jgi:hypothetical protein
MYSDACRMHLHSVPMRASRYLMFDMVVVAVVAVAFE